MEAPDRDPAAACPLCGHEHAEGACEALRVAAAAGAQPRGVPLRIQGAYLEARQALRANAPASAVRCLQWLLGHLAEVRGAKPELTFSAKVEALTEAGLVSRQLRGDVLASALSPHLTPETAWALMTLTEHALIRLYQRPSP